MKNEMFKKGFTIVELLTVMAVIAILIGLLVPALSMVKEYSKEIEQKAQFHSLEVGLELFKTEFGMYPESNDNNDPYDPGNNHLIDSTPYGGSQKLAEAMVGWDLLGFHPKSDFRSDGMNDYDNDLTDDVVYDPENGIAGSAGTYMETAEENIQNRYMFVELENANAFSMENIYDGVGGFSPTSYVLCDVFRKKRISGFKTGMPILYYKARTQYSMQQSDPAQDLGTPPEGIENDIYYYPDNQNLLELGSAEDAGVLHPLADGTTDWLDFEEMIVNDQVGGLSMNVQRPYRAGTYILISAGPDGLYGNADDICNFTKEAQ